jgi:amino acid transporter
MLAPWLFRQKALSLVKTSSCISSAVDGRRRTFALFRQAVLQPAELLIREVIGATLLAVLSFIGFDGTTTLAKDSKDPCRDIWRANVLVSLIAGGPFMIESYLAQMPWPDYRSFSPGLPKIRLLGSMNRYKSAASMHKPLATRNGASQLMNFTI